MGVPPPPGVALMFDDNDPNVDATKKTGRGLNKVLTEICLTFIYKKKGKKERAYPALKAACPLFDCS